MEDGLMQFKNCALILSSGYNNTITVNYRLVKWINLNAFPAILWVICHISPGHETDAQATVSSRGEKKV